jgi:hypothetical protein
MIARYSIECLGLGLTLILTTAVSAYAQTATFSGKVTDQNTGLGIPAVAVVALGNQTGTRVATTDAQGNYMISMGPNNNIRLRAYRTNFAFNPVQVGFVSIGTFLAGPRQLDFSGASLPFPILIFGQAPILLTEDDSLRALSVDSVFLNRDPFPLLNNNYFGNDKRTRIKLLLVDLDLFSGESLSVVTAQAIDQSQVPHNLAIEDMRKVPGVPWLSQLTVTLPSDLVVPNELRVSVALRGLISNSTTIRIQ